MRAVTFVPSLKRSPLNFKRMKTILEWIDYARAHGYPFAEKMQQEHQLHLSRENRTQDNSLFSCLSAAMFFAFSWSVSSNPDYWAKHYVDVLYQEVSDNLSQASLNLS